MNNNLIEAFKEYLVVNKALSKNTIDSYILDIKQFSEFYNKDLLKIDSLDILEFLKSFDNPRTLNRKLASINSFYNFCKEYEFVDIDLNLSGAKIPKSLPIYLESEEILGAINKIKVKKWIDLRDKAILMFLYATGVRVSELISLTREDIEGNWLRIRFAKGSKERVVPIAKIALDILNDYLNQRNDLKPELFINYRQEAISRVSVFKITKKYLNVSPHVLRHSYASSLIIGGADLRVVQELLGHSSLLTTQIYTHIQKSHLEKTINSYHPLSK